MNKSNSDSKSQSSNIVRPEESATMPIDKQQDSSRTITERWINSAMRGIKEMHESEEARQEVAKRLF